MKTKVAVQLQHIKPGQKFYFSNMEYMLVNDPGKLVAFKYAAIRNNDLCGFEHADTVVEVEIECLLFNNLKPGEKFSFAGEDEVHTRLDYLYYFTENFELRNVLCNQIYFIVKRN